MSSKMPLLCAAPNVLFLTGILHFISEYRTVAKDYNLEDLKVSEKLSKTVLSIPMHPYMNEEMIDNITNAIIKYIKK